MIRVEDLTAGYVRGVDILQGVSLEVGRGEIVTLLGPNGCGKSTLLKCIGGYFFPRQGRILLEGDDVSQQPMHTKVRSGALGFVPQTDNVFTALSVRENLLVGGQFLPPRQRAERLDTLCALYPVLGQKRHLSAAALSGGERQILALARALMPNPRTLLLDEPSAGLSPKMLQEVFAAIEHTRRQETVAILMVEQNAVEALRISDRAYVLAQGQVAMSGNAQALLRDPRMRELYLGGRAA
ncbi:ABC transporter ATP-binding protein [Pseudomonas typographi]|uniref:ABC transporter ATP-binding protein n=1 Tax=Pseudomonas typographi TaxID=2715964 RepID=UPI00168385DE|nr:ABC transporter ATP-binding protein [Pseudomonas typographi]MBD1552673.1 ABC transporter ATP-binding protein [Pseudomonas typographi]MBD1588154.1 ABC transporter ATP-binding protein [Pseudomonas typographi]